MTELTPPKRCEVSGVIHCHSTYSDGMEPQDVVLQAARQAGLDFLLMTDHDTVVPQAEFGEQWAGDTLLLLGYEITPRHNHYLVYGVDELISHHLPPAEYTAVVAARGGIGFVAHPYESGSRFLGQNAYTWEDWSMSDFTGIEIWNFFSDWVGTCTSATEALRTIANWQKRVCRPSAGALAKWDEVGRSRRVTGIGGVDAHGIKYKIAGREVVIHPYRKAFKTVRTHLLLPEPFRRDLAYDRRLVVEALRQGSCYIANHQEGDPTGFAFVGRMGGGWVEMGQEMVCTEPGAVWFSARVPYMHTGKPVMRLLKDGQTIAETKDCDLQAADQGPGVYRIELWRNGRGWVFSNPIYLRAAGSEV